MQSLQFYLLYERFTLKSELKVSKNFNHEKLIKDSKFQYMSVCCSHLSILLYISNHLVILPAPQSAPIQSGNAIASDPQCSLLPLCLCMLQNHHQEAVIFFHPMWFTFTLFGVNKVVDWWRSSCALLLLHSTHIKSGSALMTIMNIVPPLLWWDPF